LQALEVDPGNAVLAARTGRCWFLTLKRQRL